MKAIAMLLVAGLLTVGGRASARATEPSDDPPTTQAPPGDDDGTRAQAPPEAQRMVADAPALRARIETVLAKEPSLKDQRIDVSLRQCHVDEGPARCDVTLTGTVATQAERATAERVARIKGVVLIDNRLELANQSSR